MVKKLGSLLAAVGAFSLVSIAPTVTAEASTTSPNATPRLTIRPVATHLERYDISFGEDPAGVYRQVTTVSYEIVGCTPGAYMYWQPGPAYQDGRQVYTVFEGLGQGEDQCKADGTSTYGYQWYGDPKNLHPGWMKMSAAINDEDTGVQLAASTRRVWIPRGHCARGRHFR